MRGIEKLSAEVSDFEEKKRVFFIRLGLSVRKSIEVHQVLGSLQKKQVSIPGKLKTWGREYDSADHSLFVAARTQVLAQWLGLNEEVQQKLLLAAAVHDAFKSGEVAITKKAGHTWESFEEADRAEEQALRQAGIEEDITQLVQAAGHNCFNYVQRLLQREVLSDLEKAFLVLHYVDTYTRATNWVTGDPIDERVTYNEKTYQGLDAAGVGRIEGHSEETTFQAQRRIGYAVQQRLVQEIASRTGEVVDPRQLAAIVDEKLKQKIAYET